MALAEVFRLAELVDPRVAAEPPHRRDERRRRATPPRAAVVPRAQRGCVDLVGRLARAPARAASDDGEARSGRESRAERARLRVAERVERRVDEPTSHAGGERESTRAQTARR